MAAAPVQKFLTASGQVKAASELRQLNRNRDAWPYVHIYPPPGSKLVQVITAIPAPVAGPPTVVVSYTVPTGFTFILKSVLQFFTGAVFNPGDATWTTDVNTPTNVVDIQGTPVNGLINLPVTLGDFVRPWRLERPIEFQQNDLVQMKVTNVNIVAGAPNIFTSGLFGYLIQASGENSR